MNTNHLRRDFFKYTLLNIISSVGMSIYILADTFFIAKGMGADGLAALNLCLPVFNFINGFGLMFGMGGGSLFSIVYSSTNRNETYKIYTNAFLSLMMITAVFEIIGIFFSKQFTMLLGADEKIFDMAHSYLKMVLLFSPAFLINNLTVCFMRNDSAPKLATFAMLFSNFYNLVLDYEFIIEKNMGMFGAALATCISPLISLIIMSFHFIFRLNTFGLKKMPMSWKMIKNIIGSSRENFQSAVKVEQALKPLRIEMMQRIYGEIENHIGNRLNLYQPHRNYINLAKKYYNQKGSSWPSLSYLLTTCGDYNITLRFEVDYKLYYGVVFFKNEGDQVPKESPNIIDAFQNDSWRKMIKERGDKSKSWWLWFEYLPSNDKLINFREENENYLDLYDPAKHNEIMQEIFMEIDSQLESIKNTGMRC